MKKYNQVIGYASIDSVDSGKLDQNARNIKQLLVPYCDLSREHKMLVAGCGDGSEALSLQKEMNIPTTGIDISLQETKVKIHDELNLYRQDLMHIEFPDYTFDLIYSYHVLEHVPDHKQVLRELRRVLKPSGVLFIGFPNKNRLVGYINTHAEASLAKKILWNLNDYKNRLTGRFENKFGAHAGFTEREFICDASVIFENVIPVRNQYFMLKYSRKKRMITGLVRSGLSEYAFPSNYYICK